MIFCCVGPELGRFPTGASCWKLRRKWSARACGSSCGTKDTGTLPGTTVNGRCGVGGFTIVTGVTPKWLVFARENPIYPRIFGHHLLDRIKLDKYIPSWRLDLKTIPHFAATKQLWFHSKCSTPQMKRIYDNLWYNDIYIYIIPIGSVCMLYMVTLTINIPQFW